jgi:hypothetical protein
MDTTRVYIVIGLIIAIPIILFVPTQLNDHPKTHCTNLPDNTGGYYPVCTDPTYVSIFAKYISKNY